MRKKIRFFAILFVFLTAGNLLFVDPKDPWGALFVGFFTAALMAFTFVPLVERPMLSLIKKMLAKYTNH